MSAGTLRVGNCSGFYGDRLSAMREMLEGGALDVLTGDYLAELTMLILGKDRMRDPALGYARTFLHQAENVMGLALEQGVRIVSNAGGLNPVGLAEKLREAARGLGLTPRIACVHGDDLVDRVDELGLGSPLTANAYLGAFGIAAALRNGADIVVTGRVTDASLVVGPAVAHFGWNQEAYDELAGAVVAGHVLECGTQASGGNFSGFRALAPDTRPIGFPLAEIAADGSSVITKHAGTGGAVTIDTVTAQLVYEVQSQTYLGPDVSARLDSIVLSSDDENRIRISGVRGVAPPDQLKVCVNELGGFRNTIEFLLTGMEIDAKADWVRAQMEIALASRPRPPATVAWTLARTDGDDSITQEGASCRLRCTVKDDDPAVVGKAFTAAAVELGLASYPGFTLTGPPAPGTPYGIYRPAYVDQATVQHTVVHDDGATERIPPPTRTTHSARTAHPAAEVAAQAPTDVVTRRKPLGTFVHARSGDKGGDANIGLWVDQSMKADERIAWLTKFVSPDRIRELIPEAAELDVEVYPLPNLGAVNVVIRGLLGDGVAGSTRFDPQAKALGEWLRSRHVSITENLL